MVVQYVPKKQTKAFILWTLEFIVLFFLKLLQILSKLLIILPVSTIYLHLLLHSYHCISYQTFWSSYAYLITNCLPDEKSTEENWFEARSLFHAFPIPEQKPDSHKTRIPLCSMSMHSWGGLEQLKLVSDTRRVGIIRAFVTA